MNRRTLTAALTLGAATWAQAHEGHGLPGASHWHASDTLLLLGVVIAVAAGVWLTRRK
jgi:hypothetical protein